MSTTRGCRAPKQSAWTRTGHSYFLKVHPLMHQSESAALTTDPLYKHTLCLFLFGGRRREADRLPRPRHVPWGRPAGVQSHCAVCALHQPWKSSLPRFWSWLSCRLEKRRNLSPSPGLARTRRPCLPSAGGAASLPEVPRPHCLGSFRSVASQDLVAKQ